MSLIKKAFLLLVSLVSSVEGFSYFLTGSGHYGVKPEFKRNPDITSSGNYFTINQSFRLNTELRAHERASFFGEIRLLENPREARMGSSLQNSDIFAPKYDFLVPKITKLYMTFVTDYVVFEVGRRPRNWAQGLLYDSGEKPFSSFASTYDGVTAYLNPSKSQSLGFMGGYDLLHDNEKAAKIRYFNQIFGGVYYDTIKLEGAGPVSTNTGLYFAHMFDSGTEDDAVASSSVSFCDAFFNFVFRPINLEWKNEILGVWGKAAGSRVIELGGGKDANASDTLGSFSVATNLTWSFLESGSFHGPKEFMKGNYRRHLTFFDFVFLPGSSEGAKPHANRTSDKATAFKANPNFKKTLILHNARPKVDSNSNIKVDGIFDPFRMMNVMLYSVGYRYEDLSIGNFEGRFSYATLHKTHDVANKVGYKKNGSTLGFEADLSYSISFGKEVEVGADLGVFVPGDALKTDKKAATTLLAQASVIFNL